MRFEKAYTKSFTIPYNPASLSTAQEKGVRIIKSKSGKMFPTFYKKSKVMQNERDLMKILPFYKPSIDIVNDGDTCVDLEIAYMFPHASGTPKWKRDQITFMTQRPDADNISKSVVDCMTRCNYWQDDSMVNFRFKKYRSPNPCISVTVTVWKQFKE